MQFQPTLPARGATQAVPPKAVCHAISTHAPRTGSDRGRRGIPPRSRHFNPRSPHGERRGRIPTLYAPKHFNPRSPHGERPCGQARREEAPHISTHAPRTGSDNQRFGSLIALYHFNPRSPHGERLFFDNAAATQSAFQPTLPARGATADLRCGFIRHAISTHAPRTGSDIYRCHTNNRFSRFQPTLPARGATPCFFVCHLVNTISTHAPRTGSDHLRRVWAYRDQHFNPRSPHGERHAVMALAGKRGEISTHAPRTGSDEVRGKQYKLAFTFQPTLPARGATRPRRRDAKEDSHFNPRSPHGERPRKVTILSIRIIGFAQKVYHKTVLLRIILAENAVILPEKPRNPVRTSLQKAGGLRFARAIRAARPYSISSPSGA